MTCMNPGTDLSFPVSMLFWQRFATLKRWTTQLFPPWIITEDDGRILCAHCCECMAGQGETCSHIASVVFYIETFNRIRILGSSSWLLKIPNVNLTHFWDDMLMSDLCNREDWWSSGWMEVGGVLKLCKMFYWGGVGWGTCDEKDVPKRKRDCALT